MRPKFAHLTCAAVAHEASAFGERVVVGDDAPAHVGANRFFRIERERGGVTDRAGQSTFVSGERRLTGVFDQRDAAFLRQRDDRIHVAHQAGLVHDDDARVRSVSTPSIVRASIFIEPGAVSAKTGMRFSRTKPRTVP